MSTIETSTEIKDIAGALLVFQGKVGGVLKDGRNPAFKNKYATLENVIDTIRPGLQEAGLVFLQAPGLIADNKLSLTTRLVHAASGQWIQSTMQAPLQKQDPQATGSATTYLSRYSLMAILGVPPSEDDDGNAASAPRQIERPAPRTNGHSNGASAVDRIASEPTASQRIARELSAKLWKVSGEAAVKAVTNDENFRQLFRSLEAAEAEQVGSLIRERRAIQ
jgi:hypothetical protein